MQKQKYFDTPDEDKGDKKLDLSELQKLADRADEAAKQAAREAVEKRKKEQ